MLVNSLAICYARLPKTVVAIEIVTPECTHLRQTGEVNTSCSLSLFNCLECFSQEHCECIHVDKFQHYLDNGKEREKYSVYKRGVFLLQILRVSL